MRQRFPQRNGVVSFVVLTAVALLSACSPSDSGDSADSATAAAPVCTTPADSILGLATKKFAEQVTPMPHRFLVPVSTDSALPASAYWALQTTGATLNLYPTDTATQRQVRRQLAANGSYTLLLTNYHGTRKLDDGRTAVEFSGHYLSGANEGKAVPRTTVVFSCQATGADRFTVQTPAAGS